MKRDDGNGARRNVRSRDCLELCGDQVALRIDGVTNHSRRQLVAGAKLGVIRSITLEGGEDPFAACQVRLVLERNEDRILRHAPLWTIDERWLTTRRNERSYGPRRSKQDRISGRVFCSRPHRVVYCASLIIR